jgi:arginine:ornithine antiporter/lysine permease
VWLLYAAGLKYLMLSALLYAPGALVFAWALHERVPAKPKPGVLAPSVGFKPGERNLLLLLLALALTAAALLATGGLSL